MGFFEIKTDRESEWEGMPEFVHQDLSPFKSVVVHFANEADMQAFSELVEQRLTDKTQSIWYPRATIDTYADKLYIEDDDES